ncbi:MULTISPECIES: H-NS histone family protein [unclassified Cupriavidus]|uniref:H-NS histone family protein n=1 Tax=unclassified Cupriavidus TaxID=2640874 RepID=UPI00313CE1A0
MASTYKDLLAQRELLNQQIAETRAAELPTVIAQIQELMEAYGISTDDLKGPKRRGRPLGSGQAKQKTGSSLPPMYQDPKTGKTWSGRGRAPTWLGKNRDRFLIS